MGKFKSMIKDKLADKYNVNCKIAGKHVHLYQKVVDGNAISIYIHGERLEVNGFKQTDRFMRTEDFYDRILKLLNKNGLFRGEANLDYLHGLEAKNGGAKIQYEYDCIEEVIKFEIDEEGYSIPIVATKGWHDNPDDLSNTGNVRMVRAMYYGYKVTLENGKPRLVRSPLAEDIDSIIDEYPYFCEDCFELVIQSREYDEVIAAKKMY